MTTPVDTTSLDLLNRALDANNLRQIRYMLNKGLRPVEVARLLEKTPPKERLILWSLINSDIEGDVLQYLNDDVQGEILATMAPSEVAAITETLDSDDVADILQQLPERVVRELLKIMDAQNVHRVEQLLSFPEDTAGGIMNTDTITVRPDITVETVLRYLRRHKEMPDMTDSLFIVSRKDAYIGALPLTRLLTADPNVMVREIMQTDREPVLATLPDEEVARLFEQRDLVSAPVVDNNGKLLGRITIDDVVDVIREDADHSLMSMAGLDDDADTFAPVWKTTRRRAVWLGINLVTAFMASSVIGLFEGTLDKVVALAVLMPIVASMGGIAGSQTLTLVIRGQAIGHIDKSNIGWLFNREVISGLLNGFIWATLVGVISVIWFKDIDIGFIIALAIVINLLAGSIAGTLLPPALKAMGIDPVLAGSVLLTTITDCTGFFSFLGLATLFFG